MNAEFWKLLEKIIAESEIVIDRPKGSRHPRYQNMIYPVDYGYLNNTRSMDGGGIDVWRGESGSTFLTAIIVTADAVKRDSEIKLLLGVTEDEVSAILETHNDSEYMKGILIRREG